MPVLSSPRHLNAGKKAVCRKRSRYLPLEALESRTLMSVTIVNPKTATFTDVDGDLVTVSVSKGTLTAGLFTTAASGLGEQLQLLDLTAAGFAGTNLTISVKQAAVSPTGDGLTNVGYINATGNALGKVVISGDLARIDAGLNAKSGVAGLTVFSLGRQGLASQGGGGSLASNLTALGALTVTTDIQGAFINVANNIGNVKIGGSLIGGTEANSGSIQSGANIGNISIGQNLTASADSGAAGANQAASIQAPNGSIGNITIGGSMIGGAAPDSSSIFANGAVGQVKIGGNLNGGGGDHSAQIDADTIPGAAINGSLIGGAGEASGGLFSGKTGNVTVGGSIVGGAGSDSGAIFSDGDIGKVIILRDILGGDANSNSAFFTGYIEASGKIASVFVGGSIIAGTNSGAGSLLSGSVRAGTTIGSVTVNGSLVGNATLDAIISAGGTSTAKGSVAIGSITVLGRVDHARILAGYGNTLAAANGGAQIGKITVNGDWIASSAVAGVNAGTDGLFGTNDDTLIAGIGTGMSKITSITILGKVFGSTAGGDHFGFVAAQIGSFSAAGVKASLTPAKNTILVGGTDDVTILEV